MQIEASIKKPSDIGLFLRSGWQIIWKEKIIFLFGGLSSISALIHFLLPPQNIIWISWSEGLLSFILLPITPIAVTFIAYCAALGEPFSIRKTLQVIRKAFWKVIAIFILMTILIVLVILSVGIISSFRQPPQFSNLLPIAYWVSLPLSIFSAVWYFSLAEIVVSNSEIRKSIKNAWAMFNAHLFTLQALGILLWVANQLGSLILSMTATLIQSNFDPASLAAFNYLTPSAGLMNNALYQLVFALWGTIRGALIISSFICAYVKYSQIKPVDGEIEAQLESQRS